MKTRLLGLAATAFLALAACNKDDDTPPPPAAYDNHSSPLMKIMHNQDSMMKAMTMTMDPDHDFAMMMRMHHTGAISMADYELANGTDTMIRRMAQEIKTAQTAERAKLDSFVMAHNPSAMSMPMMDSLNASMDRSPGRSDAQTLKGRADHDFAHLMIVHHTAANEMARAERMYGNVQMMKDMAQMMIDDQTREIGEFQSWLNRGND